MVLTGSASVVKRQGNSLCGDDMAWDDEEDTTVYNAVVNHEEQYSIWPVDRDIPLGWKAVGKSGQKPEVLAWIKEVWTDMRPLSLQKKMAEQERERAERVAQGLPEYPPRVSVNLI